MQVPETRIHARLQIFIKYRFIVYLFISRISTPTTRGRHALTSRKETRRKDKGEELRKGKASGHRG